MSIILDFCNIAEILFLNEDDLPLTGNPIGTSGSWNNSINTADKAFDKDPLTFFDAPKSSGDWTGLDFGGYHKISKIAFLPRNDDNHTREGDEYELFYWKSE